VKHLLPLLLLLAAEGVAWAEPATSIRLNGPAANRVGITILGDGYTQSEQLKYGTDVDSFVTAFFSQSPYLEYQSYFNVHRVDVVSNESGADHPERGTFRDTALGSAYNCGNVVRVICVDNGAVNAVLSRSVPIEARDLVIVLVNDPEYGGSGGSVLVASAVTATVEIALHESGHTFGRLADEYDSSPPPCANTIEPPEVNAALDVSRDRIKWSHWVAASTPLPTNSAENGIPGAYQGARHCVTGLYRPTANSKMRSLGRPFEQVNSEQLVRRVYNFVSPIDSVSPTATSLTPAAGSIVDFSVATPIPAALPLRVRWSVDGALAGEGETLRLNTAVLAPGSHVVQVEVSDPTPLVRSDPGGLLAARRSWTLSTQPGSMDDLRRALDDLLQRWRNR
jgi:hypothetical protein